MNRPLTAEYIVELFEGIKDCQSETDWEHNKKRFVELIKEYGTEQCNIANVVGQSEQLADHKCKPMVNADWTYLRCECGKRFEPKG
jgi:hypothetical protein